VADVALQQVSKVYPGGGIAVDRLDLHVGDGELLVVAGPSGSGKSTVLRMIAGLEDPTSGTISIGGRSMTGVPSRKRDVAMVFQQYGLYPNMSVRENLAFALQLHKLPKADVAARVDRAADVLDLSDVLDLRPGALSGDRRQRVALGRALVREPAVFLMDEPLANLDGPSRATTRHELAAMQRRLGTTTVYVTYDLGEAMSVGHRVAVLRGGRLQQVATPRQLHERPANLFVAAFLGVPSVSLLEGRVEVLGPQVALHLGHQRLVLHPALVADRPALRSYHGGTVVLGLRPEAIRMVRADDGTPDGVRLVAEVQAVGVSDATTTIRLTVPGATGVAVPDADDRDRAARADTADPGARDDQRDRPARTTVLRRAEIVLHPSPGQAPGPGAPVEVAVDTAGALLFDPATGAALL
jgi:multiple sugar transport system ATP-binding protein